MLSITKPKNKKTLILSLIVLSLLVVGGGVYMLAIKPSSKKTTTTSDRPVKDRSVNDINYSPSTDDEKKDSDQAKQNIVQPQNPPTSSQISITISRASQTAAGQPLSIRTLVGGATSGQCSATLTDGSGHTVTQSGTIVANVSTYVCNLDIPITDFPAAGAWNLSIVAKSGTATSPAATQQVTITK